MEFNKCAFCPNSVNKNGKLKCFYNICLLSDRDIQKMLEKIARIRGK